MGKSFHSGCLWIDRYYHQISFMKSADYGFHMSNIIYLPVDSSKYGIMRNKIMRKPSIESVSPTSDSLGIGQTRNSVFLRTGGSKEPVSKLTKRIGARKLRQSKHFSPCSRLGAVRLKGAKQQQFSHRPNPTPFSQNCTNAADLIVKRLIRHFRYIPTGLDSTKLRLLRKWLGSPVAEDAEMRSE
jgi:hypothetical protein